MTDTSNTDTDYLRAVSAYAFDHGDTALGEKLSWLAEETDRITVESTELLEFGQPDAPGFPRDRYEMLLEDMKAYYASIDEAKAMVKAFFAKLGEEST